MALNSETPAVAIGTMVGANLTEQVTTLVAKATTTPVQARAKATATDTATITAAQVLSGFIVATPTAAATYTLPTAALLVAGLRAIKTPAVGDTIETIVVNTSAGANTITVGEGSGGTARGTKMTIAQNKVGRILINLTNVTASSEAYDVVITSFA